MKEYTLLYQKEAKSFEEALPIGNGHLGAMVYGRINKELIHLNEDTLWSGTNKNTNVENAYLSLPVVRKLMNEGKNIEAAKIAHENMLSEWSESYLPFGDLTMEFDFFNSPVKNYKRFLSLNKALTTTVFEINKTKYIRECFVSHKEDRIMFKMTCEGNDTFSTSLTLTSKLNHTITVDCQSIILNGKCPTHVEPNYIDTKNGIEYMNENSINFIGILNVESATGKITCSKEKIRIENAKDLVFSISMETSFNGYDKDPVDNGKKYIDICKSKSNIELDFNNSLNQNINLHQSWFSRADISLCDSPDNKTTLERLKNNKSGKTDLHLIELLFQYGRYLTICASKKGSQAMNLQGIWNKDVRPAWSSNYTTNINTEMNYWPVHEANLASFHLPLIDLITDLSIAGRETAKKHYNANGFCVHHNVDIWRKCSPVGKHNPSPKCVQYAFWPMAGAWLSRHAYEYYEYTMDKTFLKKTTLPILEEAAKFCLDWLVEDENKNLLTNPSTSPENRFILPNKESCAFSKGTTMDISIIKDLFQNLESAYKELTIDNSLRGEINKAIKKLLPYKIGKHGELQEWIENYEEFELTHRHVSHLYSLYPGNDINIDNQPNLKNAIIKTLSRRGDDGTGWSLGWKINLYARLRDGNHALKLIKRQLELVESTKTNMQHGGTYLNLFDAHPPFQIDGNFGATAGIMALFVQSHLGYVHLLPALPDEFEKGIVKGLVARGGLTVDLKFKNNKLESATITANCKKTYKIRYMDLYKTFELEKDETICINELLEIV